MSDYDEKMGRKVGKGHPSATNKGKVKRLQKDGSGRNAKRKYHKHGKRHV